MSRPLILQADVAYDSIDFNPTLTQSPITIELIRSETPNPPNPPYVQYDGNLYLSNFLSLKLCNSDDRILFNGQINVSATGVKALFIYLLVYTSNPFAPDYVGQAALSGINSNNKTTCSLPLLFYKQIPVKPSENTVTLYFSLAVSMEAIDYVTIPTLSLDQYNFEAVEVPIDISGGNNICQDY